MDPVAVAVIAAIVAPLASYLIAVRQFSGKIETSDAKELWAESRSIRDWSQGHIASLNITINELEARVRALETNNSELVEEKRKLLREIQDMTTTITHQKGEIVELTAKLASARSRVLELEAALGV